MVLGDFTEASRSNSLARHNYHQEITNEFRRLHPYGSDRPSPEQHREILRKVYETWPLPPGYWP